MRKRLPSPKINAESALAKIARIIVIGILFNFCAFYSYSQQARLLKDLNLHEERTINEYSQFTAGRGIFYFVSQQTELWKSTGTGTKRLKQFNSLSQLTMVEKTLYFVADDGINGEELWKSNGSIYTTVRVTDIMPGSSSAGISGLTDVNGTLYFSASDKNGRELWKSDGTAEGTAIVKDIRPGKASSNPWWFTNVNGTVYFAANDGKLGFELWKSNGTTESTVMVKDIRSGPYLSSWPEALINLHGTLFFTAFLSDHGRELWKSDGTAEGTLLVKDIRPGKASSEIDNMTVVTGNIFFSANDGQTGLELWKTDGFTSGTNLVKDMTPGSGGSEGSPYFGRGIGNFTGIDGVLFYTAHRNDRYYIWRSDGTTAGTTIMQPAAGFTFHPLRASFTYLNGYLYYFNGEYSTETDFHFYLWRVPLSGVGATRIKEFYMPVDIDHEYVYHLFRMNNRLYLTGMTDAGTKIYISDGTAEGTVVLADAYLPTVGSFIRDLVSVHGHVYARTSEGRWSTGEGMVWRLGPSGATTSELMPEKTIYGYAKVGNDLYFVTSSLTSDGWELWKTSGSDETNVFFATVNAAIPEMLTDVDGRLYFTNSDGQLWTCDGRSLAMIKDFHKITSLTSNAGMVFITAETAMQGLELWRSKGSNTSTVRIKTIRNTAGKPAQFYPTASANGIFYFVADNGVNGNEVWRSNGTNAGTFMLADLSSPDHYNEYNYNGVENDIMALGVLGNNVFISAQNADGLWEVYGSDGTSVWLLDHVKGGIERFVAHGGQLYMFVNTTSTPTDLRWLNEVWVSDGSEQGAKHLTTLYGGAYLFSYTISGNKIFFNNYSGHELWQTDGTVCGTFSFGVGAINPFPLSSVGNILYFGAYDDFAGNEPHTYFADDAPANPCGTPATVRAKTSDPDNLMGVVEDEEAFEPYPNPFSDEFAFRLNGESHKPVRMSVFNSTGNCIEKHDNLFTNTDYNLGATWRAGLYMLKVESEGKMSIQKVVKK